MAALKVLSGLDLAQTSLLNARLHPLAAAPTSPLAGQVYFNTATGGTYVWNGTAWRPTDPALLTDGTIPIAALAVDPRARGTHTGQQLASTISDFDGQVRLSRLDQMAAPTTSVSFNGQRQVNMADGIAATDSATVGQLTAAVQSAAAGIDSKPSVRLVATTAIATSGLAAIDGVTPVAGDRILRAAATADASNGVWVAAAGAWTRATDADATGEITPGAFWFVEEGTTNGKTQWRCNNTGAITLGTTPITIVQFGAAAGYTAGNGIAITGNAIAVTPKAAGGIVVDGTGVSVDAAVFVKKFPGTITGDGTTTSFTVTHNLGTQDIVPAFRDSTNVGVLIDWTATSTTVMTVNFAIAPAAGVTYRVMVHA